MPNSLGTVQFGTSATTSLTIAAGTNKLCVAVGSRNLSGSSPTDISGITFNGVALTRILRQYVTGDSNSVVTELWYLDNPDATTANLVISWTTSPGGGPVSVVAWPMTHAMPGAAEASNSSSQGGTSTPSLGLTTSTNGAMVLDSAVHNRDTFTSTAGGSQTQDLDHGDSDGGAGMRHAASHRTVTTAGSITDSWTWSSSPSQQVMGLAAIAPSPAPCTLAYADVGNVATGAPMSLTINPPQSGTILVAVIAVSGDTLTGATFGGVAMSTVAAAEQNSSGLRTYIAYLRNPATGSATLQASFGASFSRGWMAAYVLAYDNDSNAPDIDVGDGTTFNSSATSTSKSTTTAVANEGAIDIWANGGGGSAPTANSPQLRRGKSANSNFFEAATSVRLAASAGSTSDGWAFNSGSAGALSVVYLKPGGSSGVTVSDVVASCGVEVVAGTATSAAASASAAVAAAALTAVVGTAVAAAASASGIVASCAFTAIAGTATAAATSTSAAIAAVAFSAVEGTVDLGSTGLVSGVVATVGFEAIAGTATAAAASSSGVVASCGLQAIAGTATAAAASAAGKAADVGLAAVPGTATAAAAGASGVVAGVTFAAIDGTASTPATTVTSLAAAMQLLAVAGEVSTVAPDIEPRSVRVRRAGGFRVVRAGGYRVRTP